MIKPSKIIYVHGTGDSAKLNTNPWESKDVQYRYTNESKDAGMDVSTYSAIDRTIANWRVSAGLGRIKKYKKTEALLNSMAVQSLTSVPVLRGIARYSYALDGTNRQASISFYSPNPLLQYERLLLEACSFWSKAANRDHIKVFFGNKLSEGIGIEHSKQAFFSVAARNSSTGSSVYYKQYKQLNTAVNFLSLVAEKLATYTLRYLTKAEKDKFTTTFISTIHDYSSGFVERGICQNIIEDIVIADDPFLVKMGLLLDSCYAHAMNAGLSIDAPIPSYDLDKAEAELQRQHTQITMPILCDYVSGLTTNFHTDEVFAYFSELTEHFDTVTLTEDPKLKVGELIDMVVLLKAKAERLEILLNSYFYALSESVVNPQTINKIVSPASKAICDNYMITRTLEDVSTSLGESLNYTLKNIESMSEVYINKLKEKNL